jgi:cytoskeletal protein CcmA (bactofilin family)
MMLGLLLVLSLSVFVLPLLPALREWRKPSDVVPLKIDETDALDPPYLAHSFSSMLDSAVAAGASHLGGSEIVHIAREASAQGLPLQQAELAAARSDRLWHIEGDVQLPVGMGFYAEVSASGALRTAQGNLYRALWSGGVANLSSHTTVLRWVHGQELHVATGCHLAGRATAQHVLTLASGVDFMLLHAPRIVFGTSNLPQPNHAEPDAQPCVAMDGWSNTAARRVFTRFDLHVDARRSWSDDMVCLADLALGAYCQAGGSLKARGDLYLGQGCRVNGSVVAEGAIHLGPDCVVLGPVVSEMSIVVGSGCTIGSPGKPATVAAPQIQVANGATVYGTVWAEEKGWTAEPSASKPEAAKKFGIATPLGGTA